MGDLSANFSRHEFACKCGCGFDTPHPDLIRGLEVLRSIVNAPVIIASGCRCDKRNAAVGGKRNSLHVVGKAADIIVRGLLLSRLFTTAAGILEFHNGGLGVYPSQGFIHADVRGTRARWGQLDGIYVPFLTAWDALKRQEHGA